jgi:hypothetical protein
VVRPTCYPLKLRGEFASLCPRVFKLTSSFMYVGHGIVIEVPAETETDFASIPRIFHAVLSPFGPYGYAAVIHDYCYRTRYTSREVADAILLEGMRESRVPAWQRWAIYLAVRCFGWISYKQGA